MIKHVFLCLFLLVGQLTTGWTQTDSTTLLASGTSPTLTDVPVAFRFANVGSQLPQDLLHTKSIVFVDMIGPSGAAGGDWKKLARQVHRAFANMGIDAVAYYRWQDANAGPDAARKLAKELNQRYIDNVIYLGYHPQEKEYTLLIAPFDTENPFVNRQQGAFQLVAGTPQTLTRQLDNAVRRSGIEKQNHLVIDVPEFFVGAGNIVRGNRTEDFAQDLKLDKLAVPRFGTEQDSALKQIMEPYPYEYALVDPERSEDDLRQDGFQFILLHLHTQEGNIKEMLGYRRQNTQDGKSAKRAADAPTGSAIYKFYIKHIYTGDVYLGTAWDASPRWQSALKKHLLFMKDDMTVGK